MDSAITLRWIPGIGADREALARISDAYPRPSAAMGEAWFMGPRRSFPELLGDLDKLTNTELTAPLEEIVSGPCLFGLEDEWRDWHHYLLIARYPRIHEHYSLLSVFISGLFAIYPDGIPDRELRRDMLLTVGRSLMEPNCWADGQVDSERCLGVSLDEGGEYLTDCFKLAASLFFCLKNLPIEEVAPWMQSVLAIQDPFWRAHLIAFAVEAHPILTGIGGVSGQFTGGHSGLYWDGTEILARAVEFSPQGWWPSRENRQEAAQVLRRTFAGGALSEWRQSIREAYPAVWGALGDAPDRCLSLYVERT